MTALPVENLRKQISWVRWNREQVFSFEVESKKYGVSKFGVRILSQFCEMVDLNEKLVRSAIKQADTDSKHSVDFQDWTFHWMSIDDARAMLKKKNVPLNIRTGRFTGSMPKDRKDFTPADADLIAVRNRLR